MAVISLVSAKSRGVTTAALSLTLAHPRPSLLAECDPAGGSIRYGFLQGRLPPRRTPEGQVQEVGLEALAVADRQDALAEAFEQNLVQLDDRGDRHLLPGLTDPRYASVLGSSWESLGRLLTVMDQQAGYDVVIDAGRLVVDAGRIHPVLSATPLLHTCDVVLLVVTNTFAAVEQARPVATALREELSARASGADALGLLVIDAGRYPSHEVAQYLQAPVLGLLSWDEPVAGYLAEGGRAPRSLARSALMRSARSTADQVEELAQRRRVQLQWGTARPMSHAEAGVLQRLRHERGVATRV